MFLNMQSYSGNGSLTTATRLACGGGPRGGARPTQARGEVPVTPIIHREHQLAQSSLDLSLQ